MTGGSGHWNGKEEDEGASIKAIEILGGYRIILRASHQIGIDDVWADLENTDRDWETFF